ncbi:MAG: HAMP domain-containing sensor histidine kinase [Thermoproteota archaeon]
MKITTQVTIIFVATLLVFVPLSYFVSKNLLEQIGNYELTNIGYGPISLPIDGDQVLLLSITLMSILVAGIVFFSLFIYIQKNIVGQITKVQYSIAHILRGKINYKIKLEGNDEIEQLARSFELLKSSVKKKIEIEHELKQSRSELENERLITIGLIASRLAHDIRNPLSVIKNTIEIMRLKFKDDLDEKTEKQMQMLARSVSRISHQIEDVLDYVRTSPLQIKELSFKEFLDSTLNSIKKPDTIKIVVPQNDVIINCDPKKLEVVFVNLVINAIQAMNEKGEIKIRLTEQANHVLIDIEDTGPGIPANVIDRIFEPLVTTKQTGTGLGLASCKNIIEQHHGKITVSNNPTRFSIRLPKKQPQSN